MTGVVVKQEKLGLTKRGVAMTDKQWLELGREPLEFRKSDIVRRYQEEYYEIREVAENGKTFIVHDVLAGTKRFNRFQCELVCPMEQRLI